MLLAGLTEDPAENLERFETEYPGELRDSNIQPLMLMGLACLTLEELASQEANLHLQKKLQLHT